MATRSKFVTKQDVLDFVSEMPDEEAVYYGRLIHTISQKPTSDKDVVEIRKASKLREQSLKERIAELEGELNNANYEVTTQEAINRRLTQDILEPIKRQLGTLATPASKPNDQ